MASKNTEEGETETEQTHDEFMSMFSNRDNPDEVVDEIDKCLNELRVDMSHFRENIEKKDVDPKEVPSGLMHKENITIDVEEMEMIQEQKGGFMYSIKQKTPKKSTRVDNFVEEEFSDEDDEEIEAMSNAYLASLGSREPRSSSRGVSETQTSMSEKSLRATKDQEEEESKIPTREPQDLLAELKQVMKVAENQHSGTSEELPSLQELDEISKKDEKAEDSTQKIDPEEEDVQIEVIREGCLDDISKKGYYPRSDYEVGASWNFDGDDITKGADTVSELVRDGSGLMNKIPTRDPGLVDHHDVDTEQKDIFIVNDKLMEQLQEHRDSSNQASSCSQGRVTVTHVEATSKVESTEETTVEGFCLDPEYDYDDPNRVLSNRFELNSDGSVRINPN